VFKVDNITIAGGRPSIKIEVASSVVYDITGSAGPNLQEDTIAEAAKDSHVTAKLLEKIKELESALNTKATVSDVKDTPAAPVTETPLVIPGISVQPAPVAPAPVPVAVPMPVEAPAPIPVVVPEVILPVAPAPVPIPVAAPEPITLANVINSAPVIPPPVLPGGLVIPPLP
jgi:hypothetical protein